MSDIKKEVIYVDMDGVVANFAKKWKKMYGPELDLYHIPPTPEGFYSDLEVIPNSKSAIKKLSEYFDVYFLSTAEWANISSWADKRIWIEKNFGKYAYKKLILSHNKSLHIGKYLIDDRAIDTNLAFTGEFIHFGSYPFENWLKVVNYIFEKEGIKRNIIKYE